MRFLFYFLLFPVLVFGQDKNQKIESVFKDFTIETDNNLFNYKQDLNILDFSISDKDVQLNKNLYYKKSNYNPFDSKLEKRSLYNNPNYELFHDYQMLGGSQGVFFMNLIGGLIETIVGGPLELEL